ncbi:MAG: hypothetical protein JRJ84_18700 [Deltaproteobacteria bacterium]|nr:hypothetical protein [Deltaproteobacteria bacterium]
MHLLFVLALASCGSDERSLKRPNDVVLSPDGRVFVSDLHHKRIVVFDAEGRWVDGIGTPGLGKGQLWDPWELVFVPPDRLVVIQERYETMIGSESYWEVKEFDEGQEVVAKRLVWEGGRDVAWVESLARAPDGNWWIPDTDRGHVLSFAPDWTYLGAGFGLEEEGEMLSPTDVQWDGANVWVVEQKRHRLHRYDRAGERKVSFGELGAGAGQMSFPMSLGVCPGEWVAVADYGNHRVQRFDLQGQLIDGFSPAPVGPDAPVQLMALDVSSDCERLYLVDSKGCRVLVTRPTGEVLQVLSTW